MCGIVGFTGTRQAAPILLNGLSKLEYRGYDSAGIAVRDGERLARNNELQAVPTGTNFVTQEVLGLGIVFKATAIKELVDSMPL